MISRTDAFFDDEPTRIAPMRPTPDIARRVPPVADPEATIFFATRVRPPVNPTGTAIHRPAENLRETGELTVKWSEDKGRFRDRLRRTVRRPVVIIGSALILLTVAGGWMTHAQGPASARRTTIAAPVVAPRAPQPSKAPEPPVIEGTLREAVDALLDGRLDEAEARYRHLAAHAPDRVDLKLAVTFLERERRARPAP